MGRVLRGRKSIYTGRGPLADPMGGCPDCWGPLPAWNITRVTNGPMPAVETAGRKVISTDLRQLPERATLTSPGQGFRRTETREAWGGLSVCPTREDPLPREQQRDAVRFVPGGVIQGADAQKENQPGGTAVIRSSAAPGGLGEKSPTATRRRAQAAAPSSHPATKPIW
jgi:hypothetical protein